MCKMYEYAHNVFLVLNGFVLFNYREKTLYFILKFFHS